jgi:hypothetical protein
VEDLRGHVQRYVNEVKRIEELLALREKERMELLDQVHIGVRIRKPVITYYLESPVRPAVLD